MARRLTTSLLILLTTTGIRAATDWWDKKPYVEWSAAEVRELLHDSPWVGFSLLGIFAAQDATRLPSSPPSTVGYQPPPVYRKRLEYCVRLLTALAVREAMLRRISLVASADPVVRTEDLTGRGSTDEARLERFICARPNDLRVRGDAENIIIGITVRINTVASGAAYPPPSSSEETHPENLMRLTLSDLAPHTLLIASGGSRAPLARYEPPGPDHLGAKFYFHRKMPDGSPFIKPGDKELRFETRIQGKVIKIGFDLRKLLYKGKLEI